MCFSFLLYTYEITIALTIRSLDPPGLRCTIFCVSTHLLPL